MDKKSPLGRAYKIWCQMRYRCKSLAKYAGITVCERWQSFDNFLADMGLPKEGQSIDRIDGQAGYEPSNCRWADVTTQNRNRKNVKLSEDAVRRIRELARSGVYQRDIAAEFGVDTSAISLVVRNRIWKDIYVMG
jgi:hypothetical protein